MPYVDPAKRSYLETDPRPENPGDLNYMFTQICIDYIERYGECYRTFNDIMGALEGCKLELYRRKIGFYEEKKIKQNGDVYPK